jgi:hypothetical protein
VSLIAWGAMRRDSATPSIGDVVARQTPDVEKSAGMAVQTASSSDSMTPTPASPASVPLRPPTPQRATPQAALSSSPSRGVAKPDVRQPSQSRQTATEPTAQMARTDSSTVIPPNALEANPLPVAPAPTTGTIRIGTKESGVVLIVGDRADGPLTRLSFVSVPPGTVRLRLRAERCQDWDSTMTVRAGDTLSIGYRRPQC